MGPINAANCLAAVETARPAPAGEHELLPLIETLEFADWLAPQLSDLEDRFANFQTRNSICDSLGR